MKLADLDLAPGILADAMRWMGEMEMSEDEFLDHARENHGPEDEGQRDYEIYRASVIRGVEALLDVEAQADPE